MKKEFFDASRDDFSPHASIILFNGNGLSSNKASLEVDYKETILLKQKVVQYKFLNGKAIIHCKFPIQNKLSSSKLKVYITLETNFFGSFVSVEIGGGTLNFFINSDEDLIKLIKEKRFEIHVISSIENNSFLIDKFTSEKKQIEYDSLRPVFSHDDYLFFLVMTSRYFNELLSSKEKKDFIGNDHKLYMSFSWSESLCRDLIVYANTIHEYIDFLKTDEMDYLNKLIEVEKRSVELSKTGKDVLTIYQFNMLQSTIEMIKTFKEDPDILFKKLFSADWIKRFEFIEHKTTNMMNFEYVDEFDEKIDKNFWDIHKYIPTFVTEHSIFHKMPKNTNYGECVSDYSPWKSRKTSIQPTKGYQDSSKFWDNWHPVGLLNQMEFVSGKELPANYQLLDEFLSLFSNNELSNEELEETIFSISQEINENAQYVMHPDLTFDMQNNIFPTVTINRDKLNVNEYHGVFRSKSNAFFRIVFNFELGTAACVSHIAESRGFTDGVNFLALYCCQMLRDFLVPIEREKIFVQKDRKSTFGKNNYDNILKVIYVPRIKYKYLNIKDFTQEYQKNFPYSPRSKHKVGHHLRALNDNQKASSESILLARRYNCEVPKGYTFVKSHERGGLTEEQRTIYRSRSILKTFFESKDLKKSEVNWFKFENDIASMLKRKGFNNVITRSQTNDGGVDVEALDEKGNIVFVQCKCYSPKNKVGRDTVDKLIGVVTRFKNENNISSVMGIIATTSSFTEGAVKASNEGNIKLISGQDLENDIDF